MGPPPKLPGKTTIVDSGRTCIYTVGGWVGYCSKTSIPYWLVLLVTCIPLFFALGYSIYHAQGYRPLEGVCRKCSYDLRGNLTGICPECGTPWR